MGHFSDLTRAPKVAQRPDFQAKSLSSLGKQGQRQGRERRRTDHADKHFMLGFDQPKIEAIPPR
jgi:hypothetical protein